MANQLVTSDVLARPFMTALLLTGEVDRAETALTEAIGSLSLDAICEDELLQRTVSAALEAAQPLLSSSRVENQQAATRLPPEIRNVLYLPCHLRQCFVLRFLAAYSRESCGLLLCLEPAEVERRTLAAAEWLSRVGDGGAGDSGMLRLVIQHATQRPECVDTIASLAPSRNPLI